MTARGFAFLARQATKVLAISVLAGLVLPDLAAFMRPVMMPAVWMLLFLSMVRIDWVEILQYARRPVLLSGVLGWLLVVAPVLVWLTLRMTGIPPGLGMALVLMTASAPIMSSPAFALLLGLDASLSLAAMVIATMAAPFTLPVIAIHLMGLDLGIDTWGFMTRLAALIGSAMALSMVFGRVAGRRRLEAWSGTIDGWVVIWLIIFAIAIMDGVTAATLQDPLHVLLLVAAAFVANVGLQIAGASAFAWVGRRQALTVGFSTGNRNMGILLAVLPATTHPDVLIFFALAQLPVFMLPAMLAPLYKGIMRAANRGIRR